MNWASLLPHITLPPDFFFNVNLDAKGGLTLNPGLQY